MLILNITSCNDLTKTELLQEMPSIQVSKTLEAKDFYSLSDEWTSSTYSQILSNGKQIKEILLKTNLLKSSQPSDGVVEIPLNQALGRLAKTSSSNNDEIIKLVSENDEGKYITLKLEYAPISSGLQKSNSNNLLSDETEFYLVWQFEQFYAQEDEDNNIIYPVSVPAVNISDPSKTATVTYHADGSITWEFNDSPVAKKSTISNMESYQLVTIEAVSLDPGEIEPIDSGSSPFVPQPVAGTHLMITSIRLGESGDGAGNSSELQLFLDGNDDYTKETSKKIDYFFDNKYSLTKPRTTENKGSDGRYYKVVDVNTENHTYSFNVIEGGSIYPSDKTPGPGYWKTMPGFPILNLSATNHRFFLADDDEVYDEFAALRSWSYKKKIKTWDAETQTISEIEHKMAANFEWTGSSDDPIKGGAVRRLRHQTMVNGVTISPPYMDSNEGTTITFGILYY